MGPGQSFRAVEREKEFALNPKVKEDLPGPGQYDIQKEPLVNDTLNMSMTSQFQKGTGREATLSTLHDESNEVSLSGDKTVSFVTPEQVLK